MTPPPDDDDDEPKYPPPQFIAQTPAKGKRAKTRPEPEPAKPAPEPAAAAPIPPLDERWDSAPIAGEPSPSAPIAGEPSPSPPIAGEPPPSPPIAGEPSPSPPIAGEPPPSPPIAGEPPPAAPVTEWGMPAPASGPAIPPYPTVVVDEWATPPSQPLPAPVTASGPVSEPPLLPATYHENDLRAAIGAPAMPAHIVPPSRPPSRQPRRPTPPAVDDDDPDDDGRPRSRRTILVVSGSVAVGVAIAALVFLGSMNRDRYVLGCRAKEVVAEQGRSFPPWGTSALGGEQWKPIAIPPSFQCVELETEDLGELHDAYRKMLVDRADAMLTAREVTEVDAAAAMLEQALLHARSDRRTDVDARKDIQRMLGDVGYWRASTKLRDAATALADAAKQFEAASAQLPRHVSDASAWAAYIRRLVDQLKSGPSGAADAAFPPVPPSERPAAPPGSALPVEPDAGAGSAEPPPAPPDAAPQSGGVLL